MHGMYGSKFTDAWKGTEQRVMLRVWAEGLTGYTPREVSAGMTALKNRPWPPTLPEFLLLCRPPVDAECAYFEAVEKMRLRGEGVLMPWSSAAVYHAASGLSYELRTLPYVALRARWAKALDAALAGVASGALDAAVPPPRLAIENKPAHSPMPEHLTGWLAALLRRKTGKTPTTQSTPEVTDHASAT